MINTKFIVQDTNVIYCYTGNLGQEESHLTLLAVGARDQLIMYITAHD